MFRRAKVLGSLWAENWTEAGPNKRRNKPPFFFPGKLTDLRHMKLLENIGTFSKTTTNFWKDDYSTT